MTMLEMDCKYFKIKSCFQKFACFRFLLRKSLINVLLAFLVWKKRTGDTKNDLPKNVELYVALLQIQINAANRFTDFYHNVILQIEPLLGGHVIFSEIFALHTYYPISMSKVTVWKEPATATVYDISHQQGTWEGRNFKVTSLDSVELANREILSQRRDAPCH